MVATVQSGYTPHGVAVANGFVYVTDVFDDEVSIISISRLLTDPANARIGFIAVGDAPRGIAVSNGLLYVANNDADTISVIDPNTNQVVRTFNAGDGPYGVAAAGGYIYVTNQNANSLTVFAAANDSVVSIVPVGGLPHGVAVGTDFAYVANFNSNNVTVINAALPASGLNIPTAPQQDYAINSTDTCGTNVPDSVALPGLVGSQSLGWGKSWQQWPNNGTGGFVCVRQPFYTSLGTWSAR